MESEGFQDADFDEEELRESEGVRSGDVGKDMQSGKDHVLSMKLI